jgi:hypothetical protein
MAKNVALVVALLSLACNDQLEEVGDTPCEVDVLGNEICPAYAGAYPYDYAYVDPLYSGYNGYYPYTIDTTYEAPDYLTQATVMSALGPTPIADPPVVPEAIELARKGAAAINAGVRYALDPIRDLIRTPAADEGDTVSYGPMARGGASYRFTMRRLSADEHYAWKLEVQAGGGGAFALGAGGTIRVGDTARRGRGTLGVDLDALSAADPAVPGKGKLLLGFAHQGAGDGATDAKYLHFSLTDYTPDAAAQMALDAEAFAWRRGSTANQARIATVANLSATASTAPESIVVKLRWQRDVGARADAAATGGDLPPGQVSRQSACVDGTLAAVPCPPELGADEPDPDPAAASDHPAGMPEMPPPPSGVPDGSG